MLDPVYMKILLSEMSFFDGETDCNLIGIFVCISFECVHKRKGLCSIHTDSNLQCASTFNAYVTNNHGLQKINQPIIWGLKLQKCTCQEI